VKLTPYISAAIADFPKVITPETVTRACSELGLSAPEFCDAFAKEVAEGYLSGAITWSDGDVAMNALSGYFFIHTPKNESIPDYAFGVYLAFDEAEYVHPGDPKDFDNESRTRALLRDLEQKKTA
jgi:hypothetical protein